MCNLYTYKLSAWEVRNLLEHRKLIGTNYPPTEVYPDYEAPVITMQARLHAYRSYRRESLCN
jgi:hypothetical protein